MREVAVVAGAWETVASAIALHLQRAGMRVAALGPHACPADLALQIDLTDRDQMKVAAERVERELGPVSVLVTAPEPLGAAPFGIMPREQWQRLLTAHLGASTTACAAFVPAMVGARHGSVIGLVPGLASDGAGDAYVAAASGSVLGFLKSFALEVARHGVRVNGIAVGSLDSVGLEEIAATVLFLIRDGGFYAGQVLRPGLRS